MGASSEPGAIQLAALRDSPAHRSTASKYTSLNGLLYLASGGLLIAWPGVVQTLLLDAPFQGHEAALVRVLGMALAAIKGDVAN